MHAKDLQLLRASIGHNVILCCTDGEVIVAEIYSVSEEDEDIIYDVVSTNRPDASRERAAYLMPFSEVSSVEPEQGEAR